MRSTSSLHSVSPLHPISPVRSPLPVRILIADDHPVTREGLAALIGRQEGMCVVAEAGNGQEAVALFRLHQPDIALLDVSMPSMDGLEALQAILGVYPQARVILLSGFDAQEDIYRAIRAG
ncbi:MAG: two component LuxR family transcriptional regulator, partial [Chthonomonadales bacterium]|nr:two component LuxR family transcriptional regulator [Chthonomonadales bacterium]